MEIPRRYVKGYIPVISCLVGFTVIQVLCGVLFSFPVNLSRVSDVQFSGGSCGSDQEVFINSSFASIKLKPALSSSVILPSKTLSINSLVPYGRKA